MRARPEGRCARPFSRSPPERSQATEERAWPTFPSATCASASAPIEVLHGVNVEIEDGEFVILVGPSGCGKSTLLRMIAGLENITAGEIAIGERVVNNVAPKERDIAMVFQNYALYPHMTVRDNMAFALSLAKAPKAVIDEKVQRAAQILGPDAVPEPLSAAAVRRPAAARGDGPRDRARPAGVPVRRAAVQPGCQAARADALRDQGTAPAADHHHGVRHARPDRGDDDGRQDRGDEQRQRGADRRAAGPVRPAEQPVRRRVHRLAGDELPEGPDRRRRLPGGRRGAAAARAPVERARGIRSSMACGRSISCSAPKACRPR